MRVNEARRETASEQMNTLKRHFSENEIEMVKGGDKCELKRYRFKLQFLIFCIVYIKVHGFNQMDLSLWQSFSDFHDKKLNKIHNDVITIS